MLLCYLFLYEYQCLVDLLKYFLGMLDHWMNNSFLFLVQIHKDIHLWVPEPYCEAD